jgi:hypothetical protein
VLQASAGGFAFVSNGQYVGIGTPVTAYNALITDDGQVGPYALQKRDHFVSHRRRIKHGLIPLWVRPCLTLSRPGMWTAHRRPLNDMVVASLTTASLGRLAYRARS